MQDFDYSFSSGETDRYSPRSLPISRQEVGVRWRVILLSSNAEKQSNGECKQIANGADHRGLEQVKGCKHTRSRTMMLIEWDRDVAYRQSLGEVNQESWVDIKTEVKTIVLGKPYFLG